MMKRTSFALLVMLSLGLSACNCANTVNPEGLLCDDGNTCPTGFLCTAGVCRSVANTDACLNVTCNTPFPPRCNQAVLQTFSLPGMCTAGTCAYVMSETRCLNGCSNGACINQDLCTGVSCNMPPVADCQGNQVRTFSNPGTCNSGTGLCSYTSTLSAPCPNGCANGACIPKGATFSQVGPRLRFPINHLDVAPGSAGNNIIAVGPGGQAARWDGTRWNTLTTGTTNNLNRVFFRNATSAYIVGANRTFLRVDAAGITPVAGFPTSPSGNLNLVDVHEGGQRLFVVDDAGAWFMYSMATTSWSNGTFKDHVPYQVRQVYADSSGNARVVGFGGGNMRGFVGFYRVSDNKWFEDSDDGVGSARVPFVSVGPSFTTSASNSSVFLGRDGDSHIRAHFNLLPAFDDAAINLSSSEPVTGITGSATLSTQVYLATRSLLFRATQGVGSSNVETMLSFTLRESTKVVMSKHDANGVAVAESAPQGNNVFRRGTGVDEALDMAADYQAVTSFGGGLPLMVTQDNDVVFGLAGKTTFAVAKGPFINVRDAVGTANGAVIVGNNGSVQRFTVSTSAFTPVSGATKTLNAICRASDTDMFIVGVDGTIVRYAGGGNVTPMTSGTANELRAVDCSGSDVVACGAGGTVLRLVSGQWRAVTGAPNANFDSCRLGPNGSIYVAGNGVFAKYENNVWTSLASDSGLRELIILGPNEAYAIGNAGKDVKRYNGQTWSTVLATNTFLAGGGQLGNKVVFVGDSGWVLEGL